MVLFVEKRHCPRDPGIVLSRQVCTNNTVIHKSSGRIAYDLYRICDFAHSLDTIPGVAPLYRTWKTQPHRHTEAWRHRDVQTQRHRHSNTQRHRRTTETQQNHGDPTQSPWTGHLTTSHPHPHPIRPPILPPIRRQRISPPTPVTPRTSVNH